MDAYIVPNKFLRLLDIIYKVYINTNILVLMYNLISDLQIFVKNNVLLKDV